MRRKSTMKVARGRLEQERRKSEDVFEYQRVMLFILPLVMLSVLAVGIYFGFLSYKSGYTYSTDGETYSHASEPQFSEVQQAELLTVVNTASPVDADFVPKLKLYSGVNVNSLMVDDLDLMLSDASSAGLNIEIISCYISFEEQKEKYNTAVKSYKKKKKCSTVMAEAAVKKTIPNAGECEQQTGLIVEFNDGTSLKFKDTAEFSWLNKNSINYGFVLRYPDKVNTGGLSYSATLFRYVGRENAYNMRAYNMNLDEYVQYLGVQ